MKSLRSSSPEYNAPSSMCDPVFMMVQSLYDKDFCCYPPLCASFVKGFFVTGTLGVPVGSGKKTRSKLNGEVQFLDISSQIRTRL